MRSAQPRVFAAALSLSNSSNNPYACHANRMLASPVAFDTRPTSIPSGASASDQVYQPSPVGDLRPTSKRPHCSHFTTLTTLLRPFEVARLSTAPDRRHAPRRGATNALSALFSRARSNFSLTTLRTVDESTIGYQTFLLASILRSAYMRF
jgi:hypothetical protein